MSDVRIDCMRDGSARVKISNDKFAIICDVYDSQKMNLKLARELYTICKKYIADRRR